MRDAEIYAIEAKLKADVLATRLLVKATAETLMNRPRFRVLGIPLWKLKPSLDEIVMRWKLLMAIEAKRAQQQEKKGAGQEGANA